MKACGHNASRMNVSIPAQYSAAASSGSAVHWHADFSWPGLRATAAAIRSAALPSASPGKLRLRFFPSSGTTNGVRAQNAGRLITGATVTVPESSAGRSSASSARAAAIDAYSVPCTPAITVRCGPSPASPTTLT